MLEVTRRSLLGGLGALLAAPAIVRAASLMPVSVLPTGHLPFTYKIYETTKFYGTTTGELFAWSEMGGWEKLLQPYEVYAAYAPTLRGLEKSFAPA